LQRQTRLYLFDYFYITQTSKDFNLIMLALYVSVYLLVNQLYLSAASSDYTQLTYQVTVLQNKNYFLNHTTKRGECITKYFRKILLIYANAQFYCFVVTGKLELTPFDYFGAMLHGMKRPG